MIIKLTGIPTSGYCYEKNGVICPYFDNEGGHYTCKLFDPLNMETHQGKTKDGNVLGICAWKSKVVV